MSDGDPVVFIVDDDPSVVKALQRLMRSLGFRVQAFTSASEFLAAKRPDAPSCLVLDVRMPGVSGPALQESLAADEIHIPIVFITGHGDIPTSVRAMKAGAVDFLPKPFSDQQLIDAVNEAIARDTEGRRERAAIAAIRARVESLTPREREVLPLVVSGMLNKQIARKLGTSEKTVKVHRSRVMAKMQAESLADLVRLAQKVGISPEG
jgi:RNA polymerase sigma factor (sigma-70 family)